MFTCKDLGQIDRNYFIVIQTTSYAITIQSINTGHYWHIIHEVGKNYTTCQISHKHHASDVWHLQCNRHTLILALDEIKAHDKHHLQRTARKISW